MKTKRTFTKESAVQFEQASPAHALALKEAAALKGCHCEPYKDWFTYARWQALGQQVRRGEKAIALRIFIAVETENKDGSKKEGKRPWTTYVFCRCQTKPKAESADEVETPLPIIMPNMSASFAALEIE